jgi:hypothetical protein
VRQKEVEDAGGIGARIRVEVGPSATWKSVSTFKLVGSTKEKIGKKG